MPFDTPTPTLSPSPVTPAISQEEGEIIPSPTPFVHEVQEGETLLSIAIRYGVTLDGMLAANPELDPRFLSIGQELRIPGPEGQPADTLLPTSTPLPLDLSPGRCYQTSEGTWWCLTEVDNITDAPVEGLTAQVRLMNAAGELVDRSLAYAPLNRLPPGQVLPLLTSYQGEELDQLFAQFSLLSAVESIAEGGRYLDPEVVIDSEEQVVGGKQWRVTGRMSLPGAEPDAAYRVSLLVMAFDSAGQVVGYTKWEPEEIDERPWEFEVMVFSLGPVIDHVEVAAEAIQLDG
ncbi:MAG: LysM peptidoglycan-binding domain-containing protein [Anaerolineales bacterium]